MNPNAYLEKIFAGRWIAGYYEEDALERTRLFNSRGIATLINFLGEELSKPAEVKETVQIYEDLIRAIKKEHLDAQISLKPTQIGLGLNYNAMLHNYLRIAKLAKENNVFIWLDMEGPQYVDGTIKAYTSAIRYGNSGICIQAYLKRSELDIKSLVKRKAKIRLVKGAYRIKDDRVYRSHREVSHNYVRLMDTLFKSSDDFMLATHDSRIIEEGIRLNRKYRKRVTYAMLNGIRNRYAKYLAHHGQKVAVYVPFGRQWISFSYRRLVEQGHLSIIIRSMLETQRI